MDKSTNKCISASTTNKYIAVSQSIKQNVGIIPPSVSHITVTPYATNGPYYLPQYTQYSEGECPFPSIPFTVPLPPPTFPQNYPINPIKPPKNEIPRSHLETPNNFYKGVIPINSKYVEDYLKMPIDDFFYIAFSDLTEILLPQADKNILTEKMIKEFNNNLEITNTYLKMVSKIVKCCGFTIDTNGDKVIHSKYYKENQSIEYWANIKNVLYQAKRSIIAIFGNDTNYEIAISNYIKSVESNIKALNGVFDDDNSKNIKENNKNETKHKKKNKNRKEEINKTVDKNNSKYELFKSKYEEYAKIKSEEKPDYLFDNILDLCPTLEEKEKEQFVEDEECISNLKKVIIDGMKYVGISFNFEEGITTTMKNFQNQFKKVRVSIYMKMQKCIESVFDEKTVQLLSDTFLSRIANRFSLSKEVMKILNDK